MKRYQRLLSAFFSLVILLGCTPTVIAAEKSNIISFEEFYAELKAGYKKYNIDFEIENPNMEYIYTEDILNEQLEAAREMGASIPHVDAKGTIFESEKIFDQVKSGSDIIPFSVPVDFFYSNEGTINAKSISWLHIIYCDLQRDSQCSK